MKPIVAEWMSKAEGDYAMMEREMRARKNPNFDGVCFHAQQCAEKYLKAHLDEAGIPFVKTHDLIALFEQILPVYPLWEVYRTDLAFLSDFAVSFRYPAESADRESALQPPTFWRTISEENKWSSKKGTEHENLHRLR